MTPRCSKNLTVLLLTLAVSLPAAADKKIVDMTPLFEKESAGCETQSAGLAKVAAGATAILPNLASPEKEEVEAATKQLDAGLVTLKAHCAEVAAMVTFLKDNAKSTYRSVEKELDTRDNKIRKGRKETKKLIATLGPVTRKLIPLIASKKGSALPPQTVEKKTPGKFPSGRTVELPSLPGGWKLSGGTTTDIAEYADKVIVGSATVRAFTGTCNQQRSQLAAMATHENVTDAEIPSSSKDLGVQWHVTFVKTEKASGSQLGHAFCLEKGDKKLLALSYVGPTSETAVDTKFADLLVKMLALR